MIGRVVIGLQSFEAMRTKNIFMWIRSDNHHFLKVCGLFWFYGGRSFSDT